MSYDVRIHFRCDVCGGTREQSFGPVIHASLPWAWNGTYIEFNGCDSPRWYCSVRCLVAAHAAALQEEAE